MPAIGLVPPPLRRGSPYGTRLGAIQRLWAIAAWLVAAAFLPGPVGVGAEPAPLRLVVLGDSLAAGLGLPQAAAFPAVLEQALKAKGYRVEIVNAGVSGDTASGGLGRLDWSVPDGTRAVLLELGANDMLRGVDPAVTERALEAIVGKLTARGTAVMLAGMRSAPNLGPDYQARFDGIYRRLAEKYHLVLYPFFLDGVAGTRRFNQPDGMHPSAQGVAVIVERILPTVQRFLDSLGSRG